MDRGQLRLQSLGKECDSGVPRWGLMASERGWGGGRAGLAAKLQKRLPPGQAGYPSSGDRNVPPGRTVPPVAANWRPELRLVPVLEGPAGRPGLAMAL